MKQIVCNYEENSLHQMDIPEPGLLLGKNGWCSMHHSFFNQSDGLNRHLDSLLGIQKYINIFYVSFT